MKKLPEGVIPRTLSLQNNIPLKQITIRNGFLWGKNEKDLFVHVNLNNRDNLNVKVFSDIGEIEDYSVSPNGDMCYVKTKSRRPTYYIFNIDLTKVKRDLIGGYEAKAVHWFYLKDKVKPFLFLYTEEFEPSKGTLGPYLLCFFNFNSNIKSCTIMSIQIPGRVKSFSLFQYDNNKIGATFVIKEDKRSNNLQLRLYPIILDENFMDITGKEFTRKNLFFSENKVIEETTHLSNIIVSFLVDNIILHLLDPTIDVNVRNIYDKGNCFSVIPNLKYLFVSHNIVFQIDDQKLYIFIMSKNALNNSIDCIQLYDDSIFEFDTYSSNLYSISNDNQVTNYQFTSNIQATGFDSFLFWLYSRLNKKHNQKESLEAAACILSQASISFDQKFDLLRNQSDYLRLEVCLKMLEGMNKNYHRQRTVIAIMALDLYVRKETSEKISNPLERKARIDEFIKWKDYLIRNKILTTSIIEKVLIQYNWNEALNAILQPSASFDLNMQLCQYDEALGHLMKIKQPETFSYSALRLHSLIPGEGVYDVVKKRDDAVHKGTLIPLMNNQYYVDHIKHLFLSGQLNTDWLRSLFSLYIAKYPDSLLINQYFTNNPNEIDVMIRSLLNSQRYFEVAHGICSIGNKSDLLLMAVSILSKVSPQKAFDLIPEDIPLTLKRRCSLKILRSLKREDAEVIVQKTLLNSISGIDAETLIEFMPQTAKVGDLSKTIKRYVNRNLAFENEEKLKSEEALVGIQNSNELVEKKEPSVIKLYKYSTCDSCGRPLLNEPAVVYPCSHAFHIRCALNIFNNVLFVDPNYPPKNNSNNNNSNNNLSSNSTFCSSSALFNLNNSKPDLNADCPLCGFLCIKMISHPFEPNRDPYKDEWATDQETLSRLLK